MPCIIMMPGRRNGETVPCMDIPELDCIEFLFRAKKRLLHIQGTYRSSAQPHPLERPAVLKDPGGPKNPDPSVQRNPQHASDLCQPCWGNRTCQTGCSCPSCNPVTICTPSRDQWVRRDKAIRIEPAGIESFLCSNLMLHSELNMRYQELKCPTVNIKCSPWTAGIKPTLYACALT